MNRFIILASLLLVSLSCSKEQGEPTEQNTGITVSLTASLAATRVKPDYTTNPDSWRFEWESDDVIMGWASGSGYKVPEPFETKDYDPQLSTFEGKVESDKDYRFIYPFEGNLALEDQYSIDLSDQTEMDELDKTYLINDTLISGSSLIDGTVTNLSMKHIGAFMVVDIYMDNYRDDKVYKLSKVKYYSSNNGIVSNAVLDMTKGVDEEDFYIDPYSRAISVTPDDTFKPAVDDPTYLQAFARFNILPSVVEPYETLTIELEIEIYNKGANGEALDQERKLTPTVTIQNDTGNQIPFARATHNVTYLTVDCGVEIIDAKINDWGEVVENGDLELNAITYAASEINADNIPEDDTWLIIDKTIESSYTAGLKEALREAQNAGRAIRILLPNATSIGERSFGNGLSSIDIPKVTSIGDYAFSFCTTLIEVTNSDKVMSIGEKSFSRTSITSFDFTNTTSIGNGAFGLVNLSTLILNWDSDNVLNFNDAWDFNSIGTVYIPAGTTAAYQAKGWGEFNLQERTE